MYHSYTLLVTLRLYLDSAASLVRLLIVDKPSWDCWGMASGHGVWRLFLSFQFIYSCCQSLHCDRCVR